MALKDWRVSGFTILDSVVGARLLIRVSLQIYIGGVIYFGLNCALASLGAFLPTIIKTLGFSLYFSRSNIPNYSLTHST